MQRRNSPRSEPPTFACDGRIRSGRATDVVRHRTVAAIVMHGDARGMGGPEIFEGIGRGYFPV
jgi:hypothetical protein